MPSFLLLLCSAAFLLPAGSQRSTLPQQASATAMSNAYATSAQGGGVVSAVVINGDRTKPVAGITVHLVNKRTHFDVLQKTGEDGTVAFENVPFGAHYTLAVYDTTGRLLATDPDFSLTEADPLHTPLPDLDIARGQAAAKHSR